VGTAVGEGVAATVGVGVTEGSAGVAVGAAVRGATVAETLGSELALCVGDALGEGFAEGACCAEMIAAPSRSSATRASAAKTENTVDHRSAAGRAVTRVGGGAAALVSAGGRSIRSVASSFGGAGLSFTC
jgi:hypothetical protein